MSNSRRSFVKKALGAGAVIATATSVCLAKNNKNEFSSSGVVIGKSKKKEVLYKETKEWEDFYKRSY